ncbi:hypothetical protein Halhy_6676 (plasmid) [Haliscomenobacter hydrossis DSM 1100]|uniref:Uncharacterized protein n=1 Tax=Haliscomenobacter hydrossis (strain ATCC 27775 / DSM 1100 / LMG 10767 / O) TaxID=760192 RepID=F4L7Y4_HALH1|nr:hypothetical protein Halhy_6676 [Haliscomenobacter hydrossis DSM 1100]
MLNTFKIKLNYLKFNLKLGTIFFAQSVITSLFRLPFDLILLKYLHYR